MLPKVSKQRIVYSIEPSNSDEYTRDLDRQYSRYALAYDIAVKRPPVWKTWIKSVISLIEGKRVQEVSFGTGYLLTQYAGRYDTCGIDAELQQANASARPFPDCSFDTIASTMAFSGYPHGEQVISEIRCVLAPGGLLLIVDFDYPGNRNILGYALTKIMERAGDTIRDISQLFQDNEFDHSTKEIGGFGSVHQYIARKR